MLLGLLAALGAAVVFGGAAVLQAVVVRRHGLLSWSMSSVVVLYLLGWLLHLVAIARLPLYVAQMAVGGSLAVTALVASRLVREPLERRHWVAIGAMVVAFAVLVLSAGRPGQHGHHIHLGFILLGCALLLALLGSLALRAPRRKGGLALALLAGLAYAGAPVATRHIVDPAFDVHTGIAALTIPMFGLLGFAMQSLAMQRVPVTAATAPMVLAETFVPAALGVVLFEDQVRHGWGLAALLAFLLASGGAYVLSSAEDLVEHLGPAPEPSPRAGEVEAGDR